jgi:Rrf2 family protein
VVHLARRREQGPVTALDLAEAAEVPANYMGKILHELARRGVLKSARGKRGGFELAVDPDELPLLAIASPFDNLGEGRRCLLGRAECSDRDPCSAHARWGKVADQIDTFFQTTTVADVLEQ